MRTLWAMLSLALTLSGLCPPERAQAWTRTEVTAMRAHAEVAQSGAARVSLDLRVEVRGGWVERFELAGLGAVSGVDPGKPPTWIGEDGRKYAPSAGLAMHGERDAGSGTLVLSFGDRAQAPHRGRYRALVTYETQLAPGLAAAPRSLALPAWPAALENVELWVDAPAGTQWLDAGNTSLAERVVLDRGALSVLHVLRAQLPRTEALEVQLVLPIARTHASPSQRAPQPELSVEQRTEPGLLSDSMLSNRLLSSGLFSDGLSLLSLLGLLALKHRLTAKDPRTRTGAAATSAAQAAFRAASRSDLERARRSVFLRLWGPSSVLDATTPLGGVLLASSGLLTAFVVMQASDAARLEPFIAAWLLAAPLWLVRTRRSQMPDASDALLALAQARPAIAAAARKLGARALLEVTRDAPCAPARLVRIRIATRDHGDELALVLAHDRAGNPTLAWRLHNAPDLTATTQPEVDLAALLAPAAADDAHPFASAA